jgi:hypothetical protein
MHDGIPFQERIRWRITSRIRDGVLPRRSPHDVLTALGHGRTCDGCGERITGADAEVDATFLDSVPLRAAKALRVTIPPSLLLRADQVSACPEKGRCD